MCIAIHSFSLSLWAACEAHQEFLSSFVPMEGFSGIQLWKCQLFCLAAIAESVLILSNVDCGRSLRAWNSPL